MKSTSLPVTSLAAVAFTLFLSGCMHPSSPGHHDSTHHGGMHSSKGAMGPASKMDHAAMCDVYGKMTPEERKSMMEAHHPDVSPEMREQHEKMMLNKCAQMH